MRKTNLVHLVLLRREVRVMTAFISSTILECMQGFFSHSNGDITLGAMAYL